MKFLDKIIMWVSVSPLQLIINCTNWLIIILVYVRFIEIYAYTAVAPIPIALLMNNSMQSTGKNFLLSYAAVVLQGVLYIICIGIYGALVASAGTSENIDEALTQTLTYSGVLGFSLFRCSHWAKTILGMS